MRLFKRITRYLRWPIYQIQLGEPSAYCFHCRERRHMRDTGITTQSNGRRRRYGRCAVCDYRMSLLMGGI